MSSSIPFAGENPPVDPRDSAFAGRYRIIRKLGTGAMGPVYLAEHLEIGRLTAVKVLRESISRSASASEQFVEGARNAAKIHHPHVCAVYDVGETEEGLLFVAMEYVEGASLGDVLARMPRFSIERACRIVLQVLEALGAAHALGIVHRDLKPGNIILAVGDDGDDHVKVLDFDIASRMVVEGDAPDARLMIGSPEYMSPEQLRGESVDGRSDLYSLGIILYRTVTGNFPFSAKGAQELMLKRLTEDPIPLREVSPAGRFLPGLQELIDAALARNPDDRFSTAEEMAWALTQVADPRVLQLHGRRHARRAAADDEEETQDRPRSPFKRPVIRVLAFWAVGLVLGMFLGLIPNPFAFADSTPTEASTPEAAAVDVASITDPATAAVPDNTLTRPDATSEPVMPETGSANSQPSAAATGASPAAESPPEPAPEPAPEPVSESTLDEAVVRNEIQDMLQSVPRSARPELQTIAERAGVIYGSEALTPRTRAEAAYVASSAFAMLQDVDAMIQWARSALRQNPSHAGAQELLAAVNR